MKVGGDQQFSNGLPVVQEFIEGPQGHPWGVPAWKPLPSNPQLHFNLSSYGDSSFMLKKGFYGHLAHH